MLALLSVASTLCYCYCCCWFLSHAAALPSSHTPPSLPPPQFAPAPFPTTPPPTPSLHCLRARVPDAPPACTCRPLPKFPNRYHRPNFVRPPLSPAPPLQPPLPPSSPPLQPALVTPPPPFTPHPRHPDSLSPRRTTCVHVPAPPLGPTNVPASRLPAHHCHRPLRLTPPCDRPFLNTPPPLPLLGSPCIFTLRARVPDAPPACTRRQGGQQQ
jgi:hypothetical protein